MYEVSFDLFDVGLPVCVPWQDMLWASIQHGFVPLSHVHVVMKHAILELLEGVGSLGNRLLGSLQH